MDCGFVIYMQRSDCSGIAASHEKRGEGQRRGKGIRRIFHIRVMAAYGLMLGTMFINMIAMRYVPYKYVAVLGTFSYIFVLLLGYFVLKEHIGKVRALGACVILAGIVLFNWE